MSSSHALFKKKVRALKDKGVYIPCPETVEITDDVNIDRISGNGVTIHAGCRITGSSTLIMDGVKIGFDSPASIHDCQIGRDCRISGGTFYNSCFLRGVEIGPGAHVREACLLEEYSKIAHTVGLKHTILFPFVTLGSLINFCDCLMAGGTGSKNHSEVGSSYIHFNFTPNQDKATPSLIGDVPRGVMLNQNPIFLGGQGGLVGPVSIAYGTVVAAGTILRKDVRKENLMVFDFPSVSMKVPFSKDLYRNVNRIIRMNINYISNLIALKTWYREVRTMFCAENRGEKDLIAGGMEKIDMAIHERIKRLGQVAERMPLSIATYKENGGTSETTVRQQQNFFEKWPLMETALKDSIDMTIDPPERKLFLDRIRKARDENMDYIDAIRSLEQIESELGIKWLQGVVATVTERVMAIL